MIWTSVNRSSITDKEINEKQCGFRDGRECEIWALEQSTNKTKANMGWKTKKLMGK